MSQGAEFDVDVVECIVSGIERLSEERFTFWDKSPEGAEAWGLI